MTTLKLATLIPARQQRLWGWPAVLTFGASGLGAGFYMVAAVATNFLPSPALTLASSLGPALVLAGFVAVGTEAGRPWRGLRVLTRLGTSWMSREAWAGGAFVGLALAEFVVGTPGQRLLAAVAAAALVLAQGFLLRRARGMTAWDVAPMPLIFLVSSLISGLGLHTLAEVASSRGPGGGALVAMLSLLALGTLLWLIYLTWSDEAAFIEATQPLRRGSTALTVIGGGYLAPFLLAALALALPGASRTAAALAAVLMLIGQVQAKASLVLTASQLRPITLARLRLDRRPP